MDSSSSHTFPSYKLFSSLFLIYGPCLFIDFTAYHILFSALRISEFVSILFIYFVL